MARIILIEPDRVLAEIYVRSLETDCHQVVACAGAQAAIMAADQGRPDLVILELQLIEHSGIEFLYEFRSYSEWQAIPILIQTTVPPAEFNDSVQQLRHELNIGGYLYKPHTSLSQLLAAIHEQLPVTV